MSAPTYSDPVLRLGPEVADRARRRFPELYRAAEAGRGTVDTLLQARRLRRPPLNDPGDWEVSHYLEGKLRESFETRFGPISSSYWCTRAYGGGVVTESGYINSALSSRDEELMTIEVSIKQLARDAQRTFLAERSADRVRAEHLASLSEISTTLFSALSRVLDTADVLADPDRTPAEVKSALKATRAEWRLARHRTQVLIQRQARLEYFYGVLLGAPLAIVLFAVLGGLGAAQWSDAVSASSFLAATICGSLGAVVSVTQRMATGTLKIDYTAPTSSKMLLGAWRPFLGGTLGGVLQFAIIGGLLTVQGREPTPDSPATFAFYALVGFAGGFSERLATDLLERAGQLISPSRTPDPAPEDGEQAEPVPSTATGATARRPVVA